MNELYHFSRLKEAVLRSYCEAQPGWQRPLSAFGVREIAKFQELLQQRTGGRISEKWFYTHLKPESSEKLPRIDVLDLLSRFVGQEDWTAFRATVEGSHTPKLGGNLKLPPNLPAGSEKLSSNLNSAPDLPAGQARQWLKITALLGMGALGCLLLVSLLGSLTPTGKKSLQACFADALTRQPIVGAGLELRVLRAGESPQSALLDSSGCHTFQQEGESLTFAVRADYYLPDTLTRTLRSEAQEETFYLRRDDYALMIHLFSSGKVQDWQQRRQQLERMIADDAMIFQVDEATNSGTELYDKQGFISKLSLPLSGLKNLRVLETEYDGEGRILALWFVQ